MTNKKESTTVIGHLEELRKRIIISIIAILVGFAITYAYKDYFFLILIGPLKNKVVFLNPVEGFLAYFKLALIGGLIVSAPVVSYQAWGFIAPALYKNEKKYTYIYLPLIIILFFCGIVFGYLVLNTILKFLMGFKNEWLEPMISISSYLSFVLVFILGCGVIFELPVLLLILAKLNIVSSKILIRKWKFALLGAFILAAVITPSPDVFTQFLVALPLLLLYSLSIVLIKIVRK